MTHRTSVETASGVALVVFFACLCLQVSSAEMLFSDQVYTPCGVTGNYSVLGFQGPLTKQSHAISGTVIIYDDCHFAVTNMTWDGLSGPITFWGAVQGEDPSSLGFPLDPTFQISQKWAGTRTVVVGLAISLTWDNVEVIHVWCETCNGGKGISLGQVALQDVPAARATSKALVDLRNSIRNESTTLGILQNSPPRMTPPPSTPSGGPTNSSSFQNCFQVSKNTLNIHWTFVNGTGGTGAYIEWGLEARLGDNSWVGFGVSRNQTYFQMKYSDVTIGGFVKGNSKGFAYDYYITALQACEGVAGGYIGVCPDSTLSGSSVANNVVLTSSERRGDVTFLKYRKAVKTGDSQFDIDLTAGPGLTGSWWFVYATGPLAPNSTAKAPLILNHNQEQGYIFHGVKLRPAPSTPINTCSSTLLGSPAVYHPPLAPYTGFSTPPPPATPPPSSFLTHLSQCTTTFNGQKQTFKACDVLPGNYVIMWSLTGFTLSAAFIAEMPVVTGWVAVGISETGNLSYASVLVGFPVGNTVDVSQYQLTGGNATALPSASPGGDLKVSAAAGELRTNVLTILFTLVLPENMTVATYLVWTKGAVANSTTRQLSSDGLAGLLTSAISFQTGRVDSKSEKHRYAWAVHGVLSATAWGVIMPLGALVARYVRTFSRYWFTIHHGIQLVGYAMALAGFSIGLTMDKKGERTAHTAVGIVLFASTSLQVLAVLWRPHEDSSLRKYWRGYHLVLALNVLLLGAVQIFLGLHVSHAPPALRILYIIWLSIMVLTIVALEMRRLIKRIRTTVAADSEKGSIQSNIDSAASADEKDAEKGEGNENGDKETPSEAKPLPAVAKWANEQLKEENRKNAGLPVDTKPRLTMPTPRVPLVGRIMGPRADTRKENGQVSGSNANYFSISTANQVVDRRSGELDPTLAGAEEGADASQGTAGADGKKSRVLSFSGLLAEGRESMKRRLQAGGTSGRRREPSIQADKYNVKATVTHDPEFLASLKRQHKAAKSAAAASNAAAPGEVGSSSASAPASKAKATDGGPPFAPVPSLPPVPNYSHAQSPSAAPSLSLPRRADPFKGISNSPASPLVNSPRPGLPIGNFSAALPPQPHGGTPGGAGASPNSLGNPTIPQQLPPRPSPGGIPSQSAANVANTNGSADPTAHR